MENTNNTIKSFRQLDAWSEGHALVIQIYTVSKDFPKEEIYGLTNQIRRASVSITSNIAEGFSRASFKEKLQFYTIALGSLLEVSNQLLIACDVGYLSKELYNQTDSQCEKVSRILTGLIKKTKTFISQ